MERRKEEKPMKEAEEEQSQETRRAQCLRKEGERGWRKRKLPIYLTMLRDPDN